LFFDGSKNANGVGAGVVYISPKSDKLCYALRINFTPYTNNIVEYEALLHGMRAAKEMSVARLRCYVDSDLVAAQTSGTYGIVIPNMISYHKAIDKLGGHFAGYSIEWVE
jgi:probable phosphoglycerate mutase